MWEGEGAKGVGEAQTLLQLSPPGHLEEGVPQREATSGKAAGQAQDKAPLVGCVASWH